MTPICRRGAETACLLPPNKSRASAANRSQKEKKMSNPIFEIFSKKYFLTAENGHTTGPYGGTDARLRSCGVGTMWEDPAPAIFGVCCCCDRRWGRRPAAKCHFQNGGDVLGRTREATTFFFSFEKRVSGMDSGYLGPGAGRV